MTPPSPNEIPTQPAPGTGEVDPLDPFAPENWPSLPGYEVLAPIGRGGMGGIFKARQQSLNRAVALKQLRAGSERAFARSRIEAEALARLHHPNIVQIYEILVHGGRTILAGGSYSSVCLVNAADGQAVGEPLGENGPVWSVAFSPDGHTFATATADKFHLWDRQTRRLLDEWASPEDCTAIYYPDGKQLLLSAGGFGQIWDVAAGRVAGAPRSSLNSFIFSARSARVPFL